MVFWSRLWQKACDFSFPFGWPYKISCGAWIRVSVDTPGAPPSTNFDGKQKYQYSPLESRQFRLLKILPGKSEDPMKTELLTFDLLEAPPFEALSYVWGVWQGQAILVDGHCQRVSAGAFDAIQTLRKPDSERLLWVDAICINQNDISERNCQVSIMGNIYKSAKAVVVYLGRPTERTVDAMRILRSFTTDIGEDHPTLSGISLAETENCLADILGRPWFTRLWTVQEAVLAQYTVLVCGHQQMSWHSDYRTLRYILLRLKSTIISPDFFMCRGHVSALDWRPLLSLLETQVSQAARREGVSPRRNHLDVAFVFRDRQCTDPRDKYFGILGIIEDEEGDQPSFQPDYSIPFEETHRRFVRAMLQDLENDPISDPGAPDTASSD